jgi:hypothetical protein
MLSKHEPCLFHFESGNDTLIVIDRQQDIFVNVNIIDRWEKLDSLGCMYVSMCRVPTSFLVDSYICLVR